MAGPGELYQFVKKFESLWQAGRNARLYVETEAGNAFVHLQVGLEQAQEHPQKEHHGRHRGGNPARERRRERREADRKATAEAEEASIVVEKELDVVEETIEDGEGFEEDKIPQFDGVKDLDNDAIANYEVQIEAHDTCTEDEIIEAIEANFYETLGEDKVENEDLKY